MKEKIITFLNEKYKGTTRFLKPKMFIENFGKEAYDLIESTIPWITEPFSLKVFCYINDILEKSVCKMCGKDVKFNATELKFQTYCSNPCRFADDAHIKEKSAKTNLEKYGAENVFASKYGMEKIKQTNLAKYGVDNYCKTDAYKERLKNGDIVRPYVGDKTGLAIKKRYFSNDKPGYKIDEEAVVKVIDEDVRNMGHVQT